MPDALIKVENLEKTYQLDGVETRAVCGVSFEIKKGEFVAIMGPSGSGKSTLMQILGFLDRSTGGKYVFEGRDVNKFSDDELAQIRNRKIGFVFQTFNLLPRTTVFENVELPLLYDRRSASKEENKKKVESALTAVSMGHRLKHTSNQLSGGERQRVAIARALINNPEVIFADEPTGNLDSKSGLKVMRILQDLNDKDGRTIVLVTHETYTAEHADRIITVKDGCILDDSPIEERRQAWKEKALK